jgi:acyl-CoA thioester hydrolase
MFPAVADALIEAGYAGAVTPPFQHLIRVRWSDCDPQAALFNANYLTYFDIALTELWREAIGGFGEMTRDGVDMVVAEARVRYLAPVRFDDEVEVTIEIARLGTTAMTSRLALVRDGERCADGEMRHVFIDVASGGKTPIPPAVRAALEPYLAAVEEVPG